MVARHEVTVEVLGPWSLATSKQFWEGFAPGALPSQGEQQEMRTVFRGEGDWSRAEVWVTQHDSAARIVVEGSGDLELAAAQAGRFLSLDVDGRGWVEVGSRDAVIADAQEQLPGLRPCGFHSPYEAAAWAVLSQRIRIVQAASLRDELVREYGENGAFPAPERLRALDLELPGRKTEYLQAVAEAALDGRLDGLALRAMPVEDAISAVREVKGLGPFAAELVVLRGANAPDAIPQNERRLDEEITFRYGAGRTLAEVSENWRPYRTWAAVHLRCLREARTHEISRGRLGLG
ncbi:DNA-3-methyladenine glycosylase [Kribbella koreensis]|uniref:DNA-3-methyladenine glycosylase n=1 Tax=Kribbella koreensis TaxID=57909 RepID=A0ABN1RTM6_9ACTN